MKQLGVLGPNLEQLSLFALWLLFELPKVHVGQQDFLYDLLHWLVVRLSFLFVQSRRSRLDCLLGRSLLLLWLLLLERLVQSKQLLLFLHFIDDFGPRVVEALDDEEVVDDVLGLLRGDFQAFSFHLGGLRLLFSLRRGKLFLPLAFLPPLLGTRGQWALHIFLFWNALEVQVLSIGLLILTHQVSPQC